MLPHADLSMPYTAPCKLLGHATDRGAGHKLLSLKASAKHVWLAASESDVDGTLYNSYMLVQQAGSQPAALLCTTRSLERVRSVAFCADPPELTGKGGEKDSAPSSLGNGILYGIINSIVGIPTMISFAAIIFQVRTRVCAWPASAPQLAEGLSPA